MHRQTNAESFIQIGAPRYDLLHIGEKLALKHCKLFFEVYPVTTSTKLKYLFSTKSALECFEVVNKLCECLKVPKLCSITTGIKSPFTTLKMCFKAFDVYQQSNPSIRETFQPGTLLLTLILLPSYRSNKRAV